MKYIVLTVFAIILIIIIAHKKPTAPTTIPPLTTRYSVIDKRSNPCVNRFAIEYIEKWNETCHQMHKAGGCELKRDVAYPLNHDYTNKVIINCNKNYAK